MRALLQPEPPLEAARGQPANADYDLGDEVAMRCVAPSTLNLSAIILSVLLLIGPRLCLWGTTCFPGRRSFGAVDKDLEEALLGDPSLLTEPIKATKVRENFFFTRHFIFFIFFFFLAPARRAHICWSTLAGGHNCTAGCRVLAGGCLPPLHSHAQLVEQQRSWPPRAQDKFALLPAFLKALLP